jgi:FkbM family methyltransferase
VLFLDKVKNKYPSLKNIFEVGAHRGYDIEGILEKWPEANVYAFEADPFNFEICKERCKDFDNVHVYNLAIYDQNKEMTFNRFCDIESIPDEETFEGSNFQFTGCGSLHKPGTALKEIYRIREVSEEITVQSITIESFCKDNNIESVDAIFMDVQGAEMNVLKGCEDFINTLKCTILEWSTNKTLYENETDFVYIKSFLESKQLKEVERVYQIQGLNGDSLFLR